MHRLTEAIYKYYPINNPDSYEEHEGMKTLKGIIVEKIINIDNPHHPGQKRINSIINKLKAEFPDLNMDDLSFFEFPGYSISIDLDDILFGDIICKNSIYISISLLVKNFTLYFISDFRFDSVKSIIKNRIPNYQVLFYQACQNIHSKLIIDKIRDIVSAHFVDYDYIPHHFLFEKIKGGRALVCLDNSMGDEWDYSYYDFLFGNNNWRRQAISILG